MVYIASHILAIDHAGASYGQKREPLLLKGKQARTLEVGHLTPESNKGFFDWSNMQPFLNALKCFIEFEKNPRKKAARWDMQFLKREANPGKRWLAYLDDYLVIDVDHKNGKAIGNVEFERFSGGDFFSTFTVKTKTNGRHYWFKRPDKQKYRSLTPIPDYKDIELKADVSTGSNQITHPLSPGYEIIEDVEPAECPEWLLRVLKPMEEYKIKEAEMDKPIEKGQRHQSLKRYAASLRFSGSSEAEILAALQIRNAARCVPPVEETELVQLAKDFGKKGIAEQKPMREDDPPIDCYDGVEAEPEEDRPDFDEEVKNEKPIKFSLTRVGNLELKSLEYLAKDLIPVESTGQFYGDTGTWKTFYGIALACCVATGKEFYGLKTKQSPVLYIAGEGKQQIVKRFAAWSVANSVSIEDIDVFISSGPREMITKESVDELIIVIKNLIVNHAIDDPPGIIMLDTFARNFGPGDENKTSDMNLYINAIDRIKEHFRCTTVSIHHTGLINKERARGSYANKCALDFEYYFERDDDDILRVTCTKMKDADFPRPMAFTAHHVELDMRDEEGCPVTSLVLRNTEWIDKPQKGKEDQGKNQIIMKEILERNMKDDGLDVEEWKRLSKAKGISRSSFHANKEKWVNDGLIRIEFNQVFLGGKI